MVFAAILNTENFTDDIYIYDSGACGHYCISNKGMFNVKEISEGNGDVKIATKVESLKFKVIQVDGSGIDITLHKVKYVPDLWENLFSINQALKKGHKMERKFQKFYGRIQAMLNNA